MDLDKLEKMAKLILKDLSRTSSVSMGYYPTIEAEIKNLMNASSKVLPDHKDFFVNIYKSVHYISVSQTTDAIKHFLEILEIENKIRK